MAYHSFSLDPRTVLGVGPDASPDEIHDAYHAKSKKHHPDLGGDEWAFRMVTRAYEVLKTTATIPTAQVRAAHVVNVGQHGYTPDWSGIWNPRFKNPVLSSASRADFADSAKGTNEHRPDLEDDEIASATVSPEAHSPTAGPDELHNVDVELIWTRFEKEGSGQLLSTQEGDDATLSVCVVISWPPHELVDRAAQFTSTGETLRALIGLFEGLRGQKFVVAGRSRIEDGRFVGWLSFIDVLTAQDAFLALREALQAQGLIVKLYTRDERVPFEWYGATHQPVMSHAP
jgi:DnaJ domain